MNCFKCNTSIIDERIFCRRCGVLLDSPESERIYTSKAKIKNYLRHVVAPVALEVIGSAPAFIKKHIYTILSIYLAVFAIYTVFSDKTDSVKSSSSFVSYDVGAVCKAGIALAFSQNPAIIRTSSSGSIVNLHYRRPADGSIWQYKCKTVGGNQILWGAADGRWRDGAYDSKLYFSVGSYGVAVREVYSDGSEVSKTYSNQELANR